MAADKKYKCFICDSSYSTKSGLKQHEDSIHKNLKFDCKDCGKQFTQKSGLVRHIDSFHKDKKYNWIIPVLGTPDLSASGNGYLSQNYERVWNM